MEIDAQLFGFISFFHNKKNGGKISFTSRYASSRENEIPQKKPLYFRHFQPQSHYHQITIQFRHKFPINHYKMPSIAGTRSSPMSITTTDVSSPQKRKLRSNSASIDNPVCITPSKNKSPRRSIDNSPNRSRTNVSFRTFCFSL